MEKSYDKLPSREGEAIIRQSQLERAIQVFQLMEVKPSLRELLRLSQILTDFQYTWNVNHYEILKFETHFKQAADEKLLSSVPHIRVQGSDKPETTKTVSAYQSSVAKKLKGKE